MDIVKRMEVDDDVILQDVKRVRKAKDYVEHLEVGNYVPLKVVLADHNVAGFVKRYPTFYLFGGDDY